MGKQEVMEVRRVDFKSKSVDVTRKTVKAEEATQKMENFKKAKKVHAIMRSVAVALKTPVEELYEEWGWDLYDKFDHAFDAFRIALQDPEEVFNKIKIEERH